MDFQLYFQILFAQWQGVILEIPYGCFRVLLPFYPINTARLFFSSNLKIDPLNLYPKFGSESVFENLEEKDHCISAVS